MKVHQIPGVIYERKTAQFPPGICGGLPNNCNSCRIESERALLRAMNESRVPILVNGVEIGTAEIGPDGITIKDINSENESVQEFLNAIKGPWVSPEELSLDKFAALLPEPRGKHATKPGSD